MGLCIASTYIATSTIQRFREIRQAKGNGASRVNNLLSYISAAFNWAIRNDYVEQTPFRRGGLAVIKKDRPVKRDRRLDSGEELKLLNAANEHLRDVVLAAVETGMRRGEILSLQWKHVQGLSVESGKQSGSRARSCSSPPRTQKQGPRDAFQFRSVKVILAHRRFDPSGSPKPSEAYIFGTAIGERVANVQHAWSTAILKAHGHKSPWRKRTGRLDDAARAALARIDLHFHDLRREAGSGWLEGGVPLHTVGALARAHVDRTDEHLSRIIGPDTTRCNAPLR